MGCFNKIGMVSSLPIEAGDECVLILMSKSNFGKDISGSVYSHDFFVPTFLPLFGDYNDYGSIENVKETSVTKYILEFFGESDIDTLLSKIDDNAVGRGGSEKITVSKNEEVFTSLTFGLEHKSVFDKLSSEYYSEKKATEELKQEYTNREMKLNGNRFTDSFLEKMLAKEAGVEYVDPKDKFINEIGIKPIAEFMAFNTSMAVLNSKYFPSNYGSQSQDHVLHYKMLSLYRNIIVKKFERYDERDQIIKELQSEIRDEKLSDVLKD
jgi:hypothetical protein